MQLVITEKPSVARSIADAMLGTDYTKKDGFLEGEDMLISWCLGHLVELAEPSAYGQQYEKWSLDSLPIIPTHYDYVVKDKTKEQFQVLRKLMARDDVTELVEATDAGREGELIFRGVYQEAGCRKPFRRLWVSSMENDAIREAFREMKPGNAYDALYAAALSRQHADWLVGINGTRLFTSLYHAKVLKVGRVQSPTLAMLVQREKEIREFVSKKYYKVKLTMDGIEAYSEPEDSKDNADRIASICRGRTATVLRIKKEEKSQQPPKLYDLTSLQRDANRIFGFTAKQTLDYTQALYEKKLCTYPRTDSPYLTDDMEPVAREVLQDIVTTMPFLLKHAGIEGIENRNIPQVLNSKKVSDHHAIIPTKEIKTAALSELPDGEQKVLSLLSLRLLSGTGRKERYETTKAEFDCEGHNFTASGKRIIDPGWKVFKDAFTAYYASSIQVDENSADGKGNYAASADKNAKSSRMYAGNEDHTTLMQDGTLEQTLPELTEGKTFDDVKATVTEHLTKPPKHYTEDTLLSALENAGASDEVSDVERKGIGTPATRAEIIEKLVSDGFVKREKKQMIPTKDGELLIKILPENIKSPRLTAEWENKLSEIAKGETDADEFMSQIAESVRKLVLENQSVPAGNEGLFGSGNAEVLGKCPHCGKDVVNGRFGPYCTGKCGMSFGYAMGTKLPEKAVRLLIQNKKIQLTGLKSKSGKTYAANLQPKGVEPYSFTGRDGKEHSGYRYQFDISFPERKVR